MRLEASTAPKSLQASIPTLSHELHSCLCKHSVAQSIPEGSVLQGLPGMLWLIGAAGSSVLEAGLFVSPQLSLVPMPRLAQGHTLPQALGQGDLLWDLHLHWGPGVAVEAVAGW